MSSSKFPADVKQVLAAELRPAPARYVGPLRSDDDIARHRRLYCTRYRQCLDDSIRAGWDGFTCLHCPLRDAAGESSSAPFAQDRRSPPLT